MLCSSKDLTVTASHTDVRHKEAASQGVFCMYLISYWDKAAKGRYKLPVVSDVFVKNKDPEQTFQRKKKAKKKKVLSFHILSDDLDI